MFSFMMIAGRQDIRSRLTDTTETTLYEGAEKVNAMLTSINLINRSASAVTFALWVDDGTNDTHIAYNTNLTPGVPLMLQSLDVGIKDGDTLKIQLGANANVDVIGAVAEQRADGGGNSLTLGV